MSGAPPEVLAVVAQLCNLFCGGDYDVVDNLVGDRGLSADEAAGALRAGDIYTWQRPPQDTWDGDAIETSEQPDGTWTVTVPVWSDGVRTQARLRFRVEDPFGDGLWEAWIEAVEA